MYYCRNYVLDKCIIMIIIVADRVFKVILDLVKLFLPSLVLVLAKMGSAIVVWQSKNNN